MSPSLNRTTVPFYHTGKQKVALLNQWKWKMPAVAFSEIFTLFFFCFHFSSFLETGYFNLMHWRKSGDRQIFIYIYIFLNSPKNQNQPASKIQQHTGMCSIQWFSVQLFTSDMMDSLKEKKNKTKQTKRGKPKHDAGIKVAAKGPEAPINAVCPWGTGMCGAG